MQQARLVRVLVVLGAAVLVATAWRSYGGSEEALRDAPLVPEAEGRGAASLLGADSSGEPEAAPTGTRAAVQGVPVAPSTNEPSETTPEAPPAIRGVVVDELGEPLADATVTAEHDVWSGSENLNEGLASTGANGADVFATALTGGDGRFELPPPTRALATVRASREGCAPTIVRGVVPGAELRLVLAPAATLEGDVLDARHRTPLPGALVRVRHGAELDQVSFVRTSGVGRFRAEGLTAGMIDVTAMPDSHAASRPVEVDVAYGATERVELLVEAGRAVTGIVRDAATLDPIEGARVSAWLFVGKTVTTDGQGRFRIDGFGLRRGTIVADAPGYGRSEIELDAGEPTDEPLELELTLSRALRLTGRIVDTRSMPIPGAIAVANGRQNVAGIDRREWREAVAGDDGRFVIEGARADIALAVQARAPGYGARSFVAPAPDAAGMVALGDLALAPQATLAGQVVDHLGVQVPHAYVGLQRAGGRGAAFDVMRRTASADRTGRFFFAGLDAGTVSVRVVASDSRVAEQELTLHEGQHVVDLVIVLPGGETLRGRVIDATSSLGVADALVVLMRADGAAYETRRALCDEAGEFELVAVPAGEWVVDARPPSLEARPPAIDGAAVAPVYGSVRRTGIVADGTYMELSLPRLDAELRGRVLDAGDAPAPQRFVARLVDGEPAKDSGVLTDANGRFTLRVPSGAPVELAAYATATIGANDSITVLDLHMGRRVLLAEGPVARARVSIDAEDVTLRLAGE